MAQEHKQPRRSTESEPETEESTAPEGVVGERMEQLDEDIDAILDDIDEVLESNAEDFVRSFIQKGGQ